ncbi:DNA damage-inducible protein D [Arthrobacter livingstonensis]|uniref:DNA damage-inducible protein D n=1 Tax=Arthrobacter livingstonensis TaxID=670078 RepID=A0A2V5LP89_9MICC|nr:DNA damage-inducible protein D [Arthrobacter livingstonensis]PYI69830.1 DNA damage-inducible protein D [Arthrobacter livingstonensis]
MDNKEVIAIQRRLDEACESAPETDVEFWFARNLQEVLGYSRWEAFAQVVGKAIESCRTVGISEDEHFRQVTKKVPLGSGAQREIEDFMLSRYACYLIAQNGDPKKSAIAYAQSYFALQTRKQELIEERMRQAERLETREQLKSSEKALSAVFVDRGLDGPSIARVRSVGDKAFFGGRTTQQMKDHYGITASRPLADFLPSLTISAKSLINEMSKVNIEREGHQGEVAISREHVDNSTSVRSMLAGRGIKPEDLAAEEDIAKVGRRLRKGEKELPKRTLPEIAP